MTNKDKNNPGLIIGIFIIIGIFLYHIYFPDDKTDGTREKNRTYEARIHGIVERKSINRGVTTLKIRNDTIYHFDYARNYKYKLFYIGDFIQVGDSILKSGYSDTLYVIRNSNKHLFVIGEYLNKDLRQ